jgi:protein TonB
MEIEKKNFLNSKRMEKKKIRIPDFDEIVFENRNKDYGAYRLRKKYNRNVIIAIMIGISLMGIAVITPFLNAKAAEKREQRTARQVEIKMENLEQPAEVVIPPPTPPPPAEDVVQQAKYVPPVVVDSLKPEEKITLMTADQAQIEIQDEDVNIVEEVEVVTSEVQEEEPEAEPVIVVEEMPVFPGGQEALMKFISENTHYPEIANENNIQGRVIVRFCVTPKGGVDKVSIYKGVDPELDAEAIRVVNSLPPFIPGKQGGRPVPVWFTVPITFQLKQ